MGRRENAVAAATRQSEALALWLRSQRERQGLTYAAMAKLTGHQFTASMLSRGASGHAVPSRRLVTAYATACDADTAEVLRLWKAARRADEERRRRAGASPEFRDLAVSLRSVMTHPDLVDSFSKLHDVMVEMRAREGQPSLAELQKAAGRTAGGRCHRLPKSSLSVILRGEAVPSRAHLTAFMEALNVSRGGVQRWQQVWDRIASSATRKPPVAISFEIVDASPAGQPEGRSTPADLRSEDLDFLRGQVQFSIGRARLSTRPGPRAPCPPAGHTRSGLPIRTPRRYEHSVHWPAYPVFSIQTPAVSPHPPAAPSSHTPDRSPLLVPRQARFHPAALLGNSSK